MESAALSRACEEPNISTPKACLPLTAPVFITLHNNTAQPHLLLPIELHNNTLVLYSTARPSSLALPVAHPHVLDHRTGLKQLVLPRQKHL